MRGYVMRVIRLRQNTLQLAAGMNGETNHGEARQSEDGLATPQFRLIPRSLLRGASLMEYKHLKFNA